MSEHSSQISQDSINKTAWSACNSFRNVVDSNYILALLFLKYISDTWQDQYNTYETHQHICQALPNAAFIALTDMPLLHKDKATNKFSPILHTYTLQRAIEDGTVTPLLYEERIPELDTNAKVIHKWFDRITEKLTDKQKVDLKQKFSKKDAPYQSEIRIELIAHDISDHFNKTIPNGMKGQLATDSKLSAIRHKKYLNEIGLLSSAALIAPPDTREGYPEIDETQLPKLQQWWQDNIGNQNNETYTQDIVRQFGETGYSQRLIVADKQLTDFDDPRNAVLYIDKPLKDHNFIQAIVRINRLHDLKNFGLLIDYRGILKELNTALEAYQESEECTQGRPDIVDLAGLYTHGVWDLGLIARPICPMAALKFLAIERLLRVISPCHETNMTHT